MPLTPIRTKNLLLTARGCLTVLVVVYVVNQVDWEVLRGTLRRIDPLKLTAAICLQGCAIAVAVTRWRTLLANQGIRLSWFRTAQLSLMGLFFNLFFLGSLGGDAAKFIGTLAHAPKRKARLALSLIQDRLIGLGGLLVLLTGLIVKYRHLLWSDLTTRPLTLVIPGACAAFLGGTATLWMLFDPKLDKDQEYSWRGRNFTFKALRESFPKPVFISVLSLSLLVHALVIVAGYLAANAVDLDIPLSAAGVVLGVTALVLSLPITIAGLGVREGMLIWLLTVFGFRQMEMAIGLSACLLGINLFWAFAGGLAFYWPSYLPPDPQ